MAFILGLTGGIATGKSTVASYFHSQGVPLIDSDVIARQVVEPGQQGLKNIVEAFGPMILTRDGQLDRKGLGQLIFSDEKKRTLLNDVLRSELRGAILAEIKAARLSTAPLIVVDIPLLFEADYQGEVDQVMVVATTDARQVFRLMARDQISKEEAQQKIASQWPIQAKIALADVVIDNSGTLLQTEEQIMKSFSYR